MVWKVALLSRAATLAVCFIFYGIVKSPYASDELRESSCKLKSLADSSNDSFERLPAGLASVWERAVLRLNVWDTVHFLKVVRCGYEDEQSHAFFPLFPGIGVDEVAFRS